MKLFYLQNSNAINVSDFGRVSEEGFDLGVQTTRITGIKSADENIKQYFLKYADGWLDTLFIDYRHVSKEEAYASNCACYYPLFSVR